MVKVVIGLVTLLIGIVIYPLIRPQKTIYFFNFLEIDFPTGVTISLGVINDCFPTFIHTFSFCLIIAGISECSKKRYPAITIGCFFANFFVELLQKYDDFIVEITPNWFDQVPFLENTKNYFIYGTFDVFDVFSIAIGASMGFLMLMLIHELERNKISV
jgi:hypothetical protein